MEQVKTNAFISVDAFPSPTPDTASNQHQTHHRHAWQPGVFRRAPWLSILAVIFSFLCITASAAVIHISDQSFAHKAPWPIQPSTILAIFSSLANVALVLALTKGIAISWWREALHGTDLRTLHDVWEHGDSVLSAVLAGFTMRKTALAKILVTLAVVASPPLLQRASRIKDIEEITQTAIAVNFTDIIPIIGFIDTNLLDNISVTGSYMQDIQEWFNAYDIYSYGDAFNCNGTCTGTIKGLSVGSNCTTSESTVDLYNSGSDGGRLFDVDFANMLDDLGNPILRTYVEYSYAVNTSCVASTRIEICDFYTNTAHFPIVFVNDTIAIDTNRTIVFEDYVTDPYEDTTAPLGSPAGPLLGLYYFADRYYKSNATVSYVEGEDTWVQHPTGLAASQFLDLDPEDHAYSDLYCEFIWSDPMGPITYAFQEVLFRTGLSTAASLSDSSTTPTLQMVPVTQYEPLLIYYAVFPYLWAAVALMLTALAAVVPTLWGYWEVGRETSLSPLQTAKAFGAPLLTAAPGNARNKQLIASVGDVDVQYGLVPVVGPDGMVVGESLVMTGRNNPVRAPRPGDMA